MSWSHQGSQPDLCLPAELHGRYARQIKFGEGFNGRARRNTKATVVADLVAGDHRAVGHLGAGLKDASASVDAYSNQLLYTVGLVPLMAFVGWTVWRRTPERPRTSTERGVLWAFLTGILGGVGNLAFFQALVKGGKASVVAPVTALFPMVTVLLALVFLKERLGRVQWAGLGLAFAAIYLLTA
jgi:transporter family protein